MTRTLLLIVLLFSIGCTIKNHALRGAVNGVLGGVVVTDNINKNNGYVDTQDGKNIGGSFIHNWMIAGFCFTGNPVLCGCFLGTNAILGAAMTHYHFKNLQKLPKTKKDLKVEGYGKPKIYRKIRFPFQSKYK